MKADEVTDAADIKRKSRRIFTGASGNRYSIKSVLYFDIVGVYGAVPDLATLAGEGSDISPEKAHAVVVNQGVKLAAHFSKVVTLGLAYPSIGPGPDQIEVSDIPLEDLPPLVTAILELSGLSRKEADRVRPTDTGEDSSVLSTSLPKPTDADPLLS
jgi:hypothetical protein